MRSWRILLFAGGVLGNFNFFLDQKETKRTLGLQTELFYVREGVVNDYALNFVVPVPFHISELFFTWQAVASRQIPYSMVIIYDREEHEDAILTPTCNIPSTGFVPKQPDTFEIIIPCTGKHSVEVEIIIQLNVSNVLKKGDGLSLNLRRKKICLKNSEMPPPPRNDTSLPTPIMSESLVNASDTMLVAVVSACAFILVVLISTAILYVKRRKSPDESYCRSQLWITSDVSDHQKKEPSICSYATIGSLKKAHHEANLPTPYGSLPLNTYITNLSSGSCSVSIDRGRYNGYRCINGSIYNSPAPSSRGTQSLMSFKKPNISENDRLRQIAVLPFRITPITVIEEGSFGSTLRGLFLHPETKVEGQVLIKTLKEKATSREKIEFLSRAGLFVGLQNRHLFVPVAACIDMDQPMIVYNPPKHNLKRFLIQSRTTTVEDSFHMETIRNPDGSEERRLSISDLIEVACQICRGLLFLHQNGVLHKEVAARNCVLNERMVIKVSDGALSKDFFPEDYEVLESGEVLPIKWMALETILKKDSDSPSDVWSFGVLLWEIVTMADRPYGVIDGCEMAEFLSDGLRLLQPATCPDELFAVMACCWLEASDQRPTFLQILAYLEDFREAIGRFRNV